MPELAGPAAPTTTDRGLLKNVFATWTVMALNVAYVLLITPLVVRALGIERYGLWSFINGLLAYSELLYFGLGGALIKYVAQYRATGERSRLNRTVSVVLSIYTLIGAFCFITMLALSPYAPKFFGEPLSAETARLASTLCIMLGIRLWLLFIGSAFAGVVCGHDRFDRVNGVYFISIIARFILTPLIVPAAHEPLLALAALMLGISAIECAALVAVALVTADRLSIHPRRPTRAELRILYGFGIQSFFILLAGKLISYTDTTIIGVMFDANSVAVYSLPQQLVEYGRNFIAAFGAVLLPRLIGAVAAGDMERVRDGFVRSSRAAALLSGWLIGGIVSLGVPFLNLWVGPEFGGRAQGIIAFLGLAAFFQVLTVQIPLPFYQSTDSMSRPAMILMIEAILNFALSLTLARWIGISGVALATLIPAALVSFLIVMPYFCRRISVPTRTYMQKAVLPGMLLLLLVVATQFALQRVLGASTIASLVLRFAATIPCAAAAFWLAVPASERSALMRSLADLLSWTRVTPAPEHSASNQ